MWKEAKHQYFEEIVDRTSSTWRVHVFDGQCIAAVSGCVGERCATRDVACERMMTWNWNFERVVVVIIPASSFTHP